MPHNIDASRALIEAELRKFDPALSVRYVPTDEPEAEDDSFEIMRDGEEYAVPLTREDDCNRATFSIQLCMYGGGFATNAYLYRDADLKALADWYDGNNAKAAAQAVVTAIRKYKGE